MQSWVISDLVVQPGSTSICVSRTLVLALSLAGRILLPLVLCCHCYCALSHHSSQKGKCPEAISVSLRPEGGSCSSNGGLNHGPNGTGALLSVLCTVSLPVAQRLHPTRPEGLSAQYSLVQNPNRVPIGESPTLRVKARPGSWSNLRAATSIRRLCGPALVVLQCTALVPEPGCLTKLLRDRAAVVESFLDRCYTAGQVTPNPSRQISDCSWTPGRVLLMVGHARVPASVS